MKQRTSRVARTVGAGRTRSRGGRVRFSATAVEAAVRHAEQRRDEGVALTVAAREAGVEYQTLRRWLRAVGPTFRPVSVTAAPAVLRTDLVVTLAGGMRVEGLDVEGIAELTRLLR